MTVQTFFEQLVLQLGVGQIKEDRVTTNGRMSKGYSTRRIARHRSILQKPDLRHVENALWYLFCDIRRHTYRHFRLHNNWKISPKHITYLRRIAVKLSFPTQRQRMINGQRDAFLDQQDAWDRWHEIFEDFVKQLGLESAVPAPSPTE